MPYDVARSATPGKLPDPKRYRDGRQLFRTIGLVYEDAAQGLKRLHVTDLGNAVRRWRPVINASNAPVLGRHAAQALAACQLRNPTREGVGYDSTVTVFPFAFIWRAMIALEGNISSDELNRAILKVQNEDDLEDAIKRIRRFRIDNDLTALGDETVSEQAKNDRLLVWMAWASFGWTLIQDKRSAGGVYSIAPNSKRVVADAAAIRHRHREFISEKEYVEYLSTCAGLPEDLR
ncbi:MAG: hypothetical protein E5W70_22560 [Mesorhizobium sp.]|uniref:hypothetical protein n=1 Tax=Mesorhizobium sp. TaxID=1871066 RepID=UPI0012139E14|nr:hypothetical protein [Mesorhizobium sp.]TIT20142.1 MAG: hypothetical protein E5W70_22560 [Mesorhizobium sp.]